MADRRRPRAKSEESDGGLDVWLPALVAIIAAVFMLMSAHAAEAGDPAPVAQPRILYDMRHFDAGAVDREAAAAAIARGDYAPDPAASAPVAPRLLVARYVSVAALPEIAETIGLSVIAPQLGHPAFDALPVASAATGHDAAERLFALVTIAGLLAATLAVLARTWRRTQRPTTV